MKSILIVRLRNGAKFFLAVTLQKITKNMLLRFEGGGVDETLGSLAVTVEFCGLKNLPASKPSKISVLSKTVQNYVKFQKLHFPTPQKIPLIFRWGKFEGSRIMISEHQHDLDLAT
jgi:hypothetical protein